MKKTLGLSAIVAAAISFAFISPDADKFVVVIDAGHGGKDYGVTHESAMEKSITETVSRKIKALNSDKEIEIHLTRDSDEFKDLSARTEFVNSLDADLVLSIHVQGNKNVTASGMEIYVGKDHAQKTRSMDFATKLSEKLQKENFKLRPTKEAPFYVLKNSKSPAVLLELGFLTNESDRNYLTSEQQQDRIAATILEFISESK
ncbi:N-acetylmuramoyl-L-alanine amidase family protein [Flavobacterium selenitireducens]|uniref:N-acetylmuramoyl-L-alanine amidase family protein n=1 Tax=Flavobacterium selenitireducens TaxID=2722704 RepID=UPI00168B1223|nr:N-acetylmuramoyl-L-alanine amidase [Flavobacterium selenitireducens]MBD3582828.1 N-acetylmuramoyl-L-alanine amidase [Flavobacterium selenitireducens]